MNELKPCPICGGMPDRQHFNASDNCAARIICSCGIEIRAGRGETMDDITIIWNTRANTEQDALPMTEENMRAHGWVRERTCHQVNIGGYSFRFECSACGYVAIVHNCAVRLDELPNWCPNCGARVEVDA